MSTPTKLTATILPTGSMHADLDWILLDPSKMATRSNPDAPRVWAEVPNQVIYIEHPSGKKLLFDTGLPRDWDARWDPTGLNQIFPVDDGAEDKWLDSRLNQLGIEPSDIDYLLLSHLHMDHAANAQWWSGTGTTIVVDEEEKKGAFGFDGYNSGAHIRSDYDGLDMTTISEDTEILPGVTLLRTPGHTWGTLSLKLDLEDSGTMIFTSDSIYRVESFGPPAIGAGVVYDTVAWLESVEKIRSLVERHDATIVFGHDENQIKTLRTGPGNSYS